ncbi:PA2169 family four-helix-bundle protein [Lacibacter sp. H375]|uniref:ferritin-like domain-containing protein n=1 Tax=Lacibacter sp. H375 TaxID=3133424 RepID=UPI0030BC5C23
MQHANTTKENREAIADLVEINNDRIAGYEKAAGFLEEEDEDLRTLFKDMAAQSQQFISELQPYLDEPDESTTVRGKLYRAWMDVKNTLSTDDRKSVLSSCEFGEDAALRAYSTVLEEDSELDADIRFMLQTQMRTIKDSHDRIKHLRDIESEES